eukprot:1161622-Pelagomonas_calceolata.AAC.20
MCGVCAVLPGGTAALSEGCIFAYHVIPLYQEALLLSVEAALMCGASTALPGGTAALSEGHIFALFTFDYVYDQDSTQEELYLRSAQHVVLSILQVGEWERGTGILCVLAFGSACCDVRPSGEKVGKGDGHVHVLAACCAVHPTCGIPHGRGKGHITCTCACCGVRPSGGRVERGGGHMHVPALLSAA